MDGMAPALHEYVRQNKIIMIDISLIIVNYNVKNYLEQLLYSIFNSSKNLSIEIFVVDNNSVDGSVEFLEENFKDKITLIKNEKNVGFGKANNQAMKLARGKYCLLINPDAIIQENTLREMKNFMDSNPDAGAIGCKILNPAGTLQLACRRGFPSPMSAFFKIIGLSSLFPKSKFFSSYNLTYHDEDAIHPVDALSGSFMFIRKSVLDKIGYFDETYFMYGEDLDLCYRINREHKIYYVPTTRIIHYKGESSKFNFWKTKIEFYRSMAIFVKKNLHSNWLIWLKPFIVFTIFLNASVVLGMSIIRKYSVLLLDTLAINTAFLLSVAIRYRGLIELPPFNDIRSYIIIMGINTLIYLFTFNLSEIYKGKNHYFIPKIAGAAIIAGSISTIITFFLKYVAFSRIVILLTAFFAFIFLILWRLAFSRVVKVRTGYLSKRGTFFIGHGKKLAYYLNRIQKSPHLGYEIIGIISLQPEEIGKFISGVQVVGEMDNLNQLLMKYNIDEIITSTDLISYERLLNLISSLKNRGISTKLISDQLNLLVGETPLESLKDFTIYDFITEPAMIKTHFFIKRSFELIVCSLLLTPGIPFFFILLGLKKFKVDKTGFSFYNKNVSMLSISSTKSRLGKLLHLLPVLSGKMSIVGIDPVDFANYSYIGLKPGLISILDIFSNTALEKEQKASLYHYYFKNFNLFFDLEIIIRLITKRF